MQSMEWPPEHSDALRDFLAQGMSYSEIAKAINAKFKTAYTRNAAIGRARRLGLAGPPDKPPRRVPKSSLRPGGKGGTESSGDSRESRGRPEPTGPRPVRRPPEHPETASLRCVEVNPRHLTLHGLEFHDCRYPYGGDAEGEAITFCGHPRRPGSSYCTAHFHLTRGRGIQLDRTAAAVLLRLVEAA